MNYEEIRLEDYFQEKTEDLNSEFSDHNNFGCCDKYKICSEAKKCIQPDDMKNACAYNKHLEAGEIFYSKAANNFSAERYAYINDYYNKLSTDEKKAFLEIVGLFMYINRGAVNILCGNKPYYLSAPNSMEKFKLVYNCIKDCNVFSSGSSKELVSSLFKRNVLSTKNCETFCSKYSDIPFSTKKIVLPAELEFTDDDYNDLSDKTSSNLNNQGKLKQKNQSDFRLSKWKEFYINSGTTALNCFLNYFIYFKISSEYTLELEEWAEANYSSIPTKSDDLLFLFQEASDRDGKKIFSFKRLSCFT